MARTVKVEGNFAATTKSQHIARATEPDMRWKKNDKVERKNWIESEKLGKDRTTNTKFDGGWVWKADSICGEGSSSHDLPADKLPGVNNGGLVNWTAEAQPGEGAQTVYVEGQKVIRYDDKTFQNKKNSKGKIINAEELAAYLAEPLKPDPVPPPPKPKVPTTTTQPGGGNQGTTTTPGGKDGGPRQTTQGTDPTKDCTIVSVSMRGPSDGRIQSDDPKSPQAGWIWIRDDHTLKVVVDGQKCCDKHPLITFGSQKKTGLTASFNPSNFPLQRTILNVLVPGAGALPPIPVQTSLTVQSCKMQYNRSVMVMGREVTKVTIGKSSGMGSGGGTSPIESLWKKIKIDMPNDKVELFNGSVEFEFKWDEETWWGGALHLGTSGSLTIVKVSLPIYKIPLLSFLGPAAAALQLAVQEITKRLGVPVVAELVLEVVGELAVKGGITLKLVNGSDLKFGGGELAGEGTLKIGGRLTLKCTEKCKAQGTVYGGVTLKGTWAGRGFPLVDVAMSAKFFVKAAISVEVSIGWFDYGYEKEYALAESPDFQLGTVTFFTAAGCLPVGYSKPK